MINIKDVQEGYQELYNSHQKIAINSQLLIISGPSGIGRTSVLDYIVSQYNFNFLKNTTNRQHRKINSDRYVNSVECDDIQQLSKKIFVYTKWHVNDKYYFLPYSELYKLESRQQYIYETTYFGNIVKQLTPEKIMNIWLYSSDTRSMLSNFKRRNTENRKEISQRYKFSLETQKYMLDNKLKFISENKVDHYLDVNKKSIAEIGDETMQLFFKYS